MPEGKGLLIVYTGPGKGKTTCALGTAFRAVGQGLRVMMVQFIKGSWHYGELDAAKMLGDDKFEIRPMGRGFVKVGGADTDPEDVKMCEQAWEFGREQIYSDKYDLVILDEINPSGFERSTDGCFICKRHWDLPVNDLGSTDRGHAYL